MRHNICGHNAAAFADWAVAKRSVPLSGWRTGKISDN
jgi:hypothetical protein